MRNMFSIGIIVLFVFSCFSGIIPADGIKSKNKANYVDNKIFFDNYIDGYLGAQGSLKSYEVIGEKYEGDTYNFFSCCYLVVSGTIRFHFQLMDIPLGFNQRLILFWPFYFLGSDVNVTVYNKKQGDIVWQSSNLHDDLSILLFEFRGMYNNEGSTTNTLRINLDGNAGAVFLRCGGDHYE